MVAARVVGGVGRFEWWLEWMGGYGKEVLGLMVAAAEKVLWLNDERMNDAHLGCG